MQYCCNKNLKTYICNIVSIKQLTNMKKLLLIFFITISSLSQAQNWEWQNPFPVGNSLWDVAWIDAQTLYVSGGKGQFIKSNDFGQTWETAHIPTDVTVREIDFISPSQGWAATSNGEIWLTVDAGANWTLQAEDPDGSTLRDIHFFDQVGYAVGDAGYAANTLLKTTNGGEEWESVTLPVRQGAPWYGMFFAKAINEDTVYAASWDNTFFKSYDQGLTWDTVHLPTSAGGFYEGGYFVNDSTGFVVGPNGYIVKTVDYGDTWEILSGSADSTDQASHYFTEAFFLDNQIGWVSSFGCLYSTTDGGTTWSQSCDNYGSGRKSFIAFSDPNKGIAVSYLDLYITENGSDFNTILPTSPTNHVHSISETLGHLYAGASGGKIFHSSDQGQSWDIMNTPASVTLNDVQFIDENNAWAVGNDSIILNTADGGVNWQSFDLDFEGNFNGLYVWSASNAVVVGSSGAIFKTTDGGTSWTKGSLETENNVNAVHFTTSDIGFLVGQSGLLARTTDGGANWTIQDPGILSHINDIYFVDDNIGYAVGWSGKVLHTADGGDTWTEQVSGESGTLNSVFFSDADHGYISLTGKILSTEDGGQTWGIENTPSDNILRDVYFNEDGNGWVVGSNGNILFKGEIMIETPLTTDQQSSIEVFPNPARMRTTFTLAYPVNGSLNFTLYDQSGRRALSDRLAFESGKAEWSIPQGLEQGVYFVHVATPGGFHVVKLIIEK